MSILLTSNAISAQFSFNKLLTVVSVITFGPSVFVVAVVFPSEWPQLNFPSLKHGFLHLIDMRFCDFVNYLSVRTQKWA